MECVSGLLSERNAQGIVLYVGRSSQTGTFNFTGIKRDASVSVLHTVVSGKCVLLLIGGAHVAGQSRDR
jgi:hydrogenase maturation factor